MESQEIKGKMTKCEWIAVFNKEKNHISIQERCFDEELYDGTVCGIWDVHGNYDNCNANAAAICNAVNNTYGQNISPEQIPAAIRLIESLSQMHPEGNPLPLIKEAENLLSLLKLK
jgi:hypothetical protein